MLVTCCAEASALIVQIPETRLRAALPWASCNMARLSLGNRFTVCSILELIGG